MILTLVTLRIKSGKISLIIFVFAILPILVFWNRTYAQFGMPQQLSEAGYKFALHACKSDRLILMHLENIRRWQTMYVRIANAVRVGEIDSQSADGLVREIFERDFDDLHESRRKRVLPNTEMEKQRTLLGELTYDLMYLSAMRVFSLYRAGGDDRRIRRLLEENCLSLLEGK